MNNSPHTSIAIGAGSAGDGEIIIGNNQNYDTTKIDISTKHSIYVAGSTIFSSFPYMPRMFMLKQFIL